MCRKLPANVFPTNEYFLRRVEHGPASVVVSNASVYNNPPVPVHAPPVPEPVPVPPVPGQQLGNVAGAPGGVALSPFGTQEVAAQGTSWQTPMIGHPLQDPAWPYQNVMMHVPGGYPQIRPNAFPHAGLIHTNPEPPTWGTSVSRSRRGVANTIKTCDLCKQARAGTHSNSGCPFVCNVCKKTPTACACDQGPVLRHRK